MFRRASTSGTNLTAITFGILEQFDIGGTANDGIFPMYFGRSRIEVLGGEQKMKMEHVERRILDKHTGWKRCELDVDDLAHEFVASEALW